MLNQCGQENILQSEQFSKKLGNALEPTEKNN